MYANFQTQGTPCQIRASSGILRGRVLGKPQYISHEQTTDE